MQHWRMAPSPLAEKLACGAINTAATPHLHEWHGNLNLVDDGSSAHVHDVKQNLTCSFEAPESYFFKVRSASEHAECATTVQHR